MNGVHRIAHLRENVYILYVAELAEDYTILLYLERIGKPKKFLLLKEIYNRIKVITTINFGKHTEKS
jgi:hypothetical protein